jgi:hypothetical protein
MPDLRGNRFISVQLPNATIHLQIFSIGTAAFADESASCRFQPCHGTISNTRRAARRQPTECDSLIVDTRKVGERRNALCVFKPRPFSDFRGSRMGSRLTQLLKHSSLTRSIAVNQSHNAASQQNLRIDSRGNQ